MMRRQRQKGRTQAKAAQKPVRRTRPAVRRMAQWLDTKVTIASVLLVLAMLGVTAVMTYAAFATRAAQSVTAQAER